MGLGIWLGLGSNQGDRLAHFNSAVSFVESQPELQLLRCSRVYETDFVGPGEQAAYLNACLEIRSEVEPQVLLERFQGLERKLGRPLHGHMQPRPLDVDILLVDDLVMVEDNLVVPHPRLQERLFVLAPLADIAPEKIIPNLRETVASLCAKIRRKGGSAVTLRPDLVLQSEQSGWIMED